MGLKEDAEPAIYLQTKEKAEQRTAERKVPINLSIRSVGSYGSCKLRFPPVTICQKLLFVVQQFFSSFSGVLGIRRFNNGVDGA